MTNANETQQGQGLGYETARIFIAKIEGLIDEFESIQAPMP